MTDKEYNEKISRETLIAECYERTLDDSLPSYIMSVCEDGKWKHAWAIHARNEEEARLITGWEFFADSKDVGCETFAGSESDGSENLRLRSPAKA